ncbi:MAG TPA: ionic transporter y4hA [Microbacteriaceae bacterium]|nr:ionic transporter y4hA [Microbacteriaceae bacterium]
MQTSNRPRWELALRILPIVAAGAFAWSWLSAPSDPMLIALGFLLVASVFAAVHHAEIVAARVGEPFGSLVLAVAVTVVEVGMIVALMLDSPESTQGLARETVFSALMIICNGIVGLSLLVKSLKRFEAVFTPEGVSGALAAIAVLATLALVLPSVTSSAPGQSFTPFQLGFTAIASLTLYLVFVFVQAVRHRDYFLPPGLAASADAHVERPSRRSAFTSLVLLVVALVGVVGLAKETSPVVKHLIVGAGLPSSLVAVSIALVVLLPESIAALRAATVGRSQTSLNLAYGSAMASIGLTIPVIATLSLMWGFHLDLGLRPSEITLLALTIVVSVLTVIPGKASILQGAIHLSILAAFLTFVIQP